MKFPKARIACVVSLLATAACDRSSPSTNAPASPPPAAPETPPPAPIAVVDVPAPPAPAATTDAGSTDAAAAAADASSVDANSVAVAAATDAATPPAGNARGEGAVHASARAHERAAPNSAVAAPAAAGEPAELRLRIVPSGSIELDGHAVGEDFYRGNVPPGRHTVRVQNTERQASRTLTINLAPGEHAMRTIDLTRAE